MINNAAYYTSIHELVYCEFHNNAPIRSRTPRGARPSAENGGVYALSFHSGKDSLQNLLLLTGYRRRELAIGISYRAVVLISQHE